jgi:type II secretory pathway pseudopilin PulG
MKNNLPPRVVFRRGMTLLELTLIVSVLLLLITIAFIGSRAWKRGSDRAVCILTLRNVQTAARSYQNLYGYNYGARPNMEYGSHDIALHLYKKGYIEQGLYNHANGVEFCPGNGAYTRPEPDNFPEIGELYMKCSLSTPEQHQPIAHTEW